MRKNVYAAIGFVIADAERHPHPAEPEDAP